MISSYGQLVIGPAGNGKTTYCRVIQEHLLNKGRNVHLVNLDPATEDNSDYVIDIKDLISIDDVMSTLGYGPNGALIYCFEYLLKNLNWLQEQIEEFGDGSYFLFDCPGQIELYSHLTVMRTFAEKLKSWGFLLCCVYCSDITFFSDPHKLIAGSLVSLTSMIQLELPYVNVLTKCDKCSKDKVEEWLELSHTEMLEADASKFDKKFYGLNKALVKIVEDYSGFQTVPMNIKDEDSIDKVIYTVDMLVQYGEFEEPQDKFFDQVDEHMI